MNNTIKQARLKRMLELIEEGQRPFQIKEILHKEWNISIRSIERYMKAAFKHISEDIDVDDKTKYKVEYEVLIHKYEKMGQYELARRYRDMLNKIMGAYVEKQEVQHTIIKVVVKGDDQQN